MADRKSGPPLLFPSASKVQVPHVGADVRDIHLQMPYLIPPMSSPEPTFYRQRQLPSDLNKNYLKKISTDLKFTDDVVRDRCFHMTSYDSKYLDDVLRPPPDISQPKKTSMTIGRYNTRGSDSRHLPCHLRPTGPYHLKPLKRRIMKKAMEMQQYEEYLQHRREEEERAKQEEQIMIVVENEEEKVTKVAFPETSPREVKTEDVFMTEYRPEESEETEVEKPEERRKRMEKDWYQHILYTLNKRTAQWIVNQKMNEDENKEELQEMLLKSYGQPSTTELVPDDVSEGEAFEFKRKETPKPPKKWVKTESALLERAEKASEDEMSQLTTVPYADENAASFYRLPAGIRKKKKHLDRIEKAMNATASNIVVKTRKQSPPPTLNDFMNPNVGEKMFKTENTFEQEWLTGTKQVHEHYGDKTKILLENNNKYKKQLQTEYPQNPKEWFAETDEERLNRLNVTTKVKHIEKGMHRWSSLPEPIDDTAELLNVTMPGEGTDDAMSTRSYKTKKIQKGNPSLIKIIDDWRKQWHLNDRYADSTTDDLLKDMADIHPHIRLKAVTTVAKAAIYRPPPELGIQIDIRRQEDDHVNTLPEKLFIGIECLLQDSSDKVRRAAAIALYSLNRLCKEAEVILRKTLQEEKSVDRWAAAQCLAHFGICDSEIVGELVYQLMTKEDTIEKERCGNMLAKLSVNSTLPYSMLGEQLNSSSWRHRVIACQVLPKLHGKINRDIAHKLTTLMWHDWHSEVRKAAAQTLGKAGHGKDVHDNLMERLQSTNIEARVDAAIKVGYLKIMTAKLLPIFLGCFDDEYISVRMYACISAGNLEIEDDIVLDKLIHLVKYEPVWKIKAHAINALGRIGRVTPVVRHVIVWSFRFEDNPGVRAEACRAIITLDLNEPEITSVLQDRFLVERDPVVKKEIARALITFGISATEDLDMVAQIKSEVRKLTTKANICAQITVNDKADDKEYNLARMLYRPKPPEEMAMETKMRSVASTPVPPKSRPHSRAATPGDGRDVFTPTADKELEDILSRQETQVISEETESHSGSSPSRTSRSKSRSRPETGGTSSDEEEESDVESEALQTRATSRAMSSRLMSRISEELVEEDYSESPQAELIKRADSVARSLSAKSTKRRSKSGRSSRASGGQQSRAPSSQEVEEKELSDKLGYMEITKETKNETDEDLGDIVAVTHKSPTPAPQPAGEIDIVEQDRQMILDILRRRYPSPTPPVSEWDSKSSITGTEYKSEMPKDHEVQALSPTTTTTTMELQGVKGLFIGTPDMESVNETQTHGLDAQSVVSTTAKSMLSGPVVIVDDADKTTAPPKSAASTVPASSVSNSHEGSDDISSEIGSQVQVESVASPVKAESSLSKVGDSASKTGDTAETLDTASRLEENASKADGTISREQLYDQSDSKSVVLPVSAKSRDFSEVASTYTAPPASAMSYPESPYPKPDSRGSVLIQERLEETPANENENATSD